MPRQPHGVIHLDPVVIGVILGHASRGVVHDARALLGHDQFGAAHRLEAGHAHGDGDRALLLAIDDDVHHQVLGIGLHDDRVGCLIHRARVVLTPEPRTGLHTAQIDVEFDRNVARPVILRSVQGLARTRPKPRTLDRCGRAHNHRLLHGSAILDRLVEVDREGHTHAEFSARGHGGYGRQEAVGVYRPDLLLQGGRLPSRIHGYRRDLVRGVEVKVGPRGGPGAPVIGQLALEEPVGALGDGDISQVAIVDVDHDGSINGGIIGNGLNESELGDGLARQLGRGQIHDRLAGRHAQQGESGE